MTLNSSGQHDFVTCDEYLGPSSRKLTVIMLSDSFKYTHMLAEALRSESFDLKIFGPKRVLRNKPRELNSGYGCAIPVWTSNFLALQVLWKTFRTMKSKCVVHVQHEFYGCLSFGPMHTNIQLLLLFLLLRFLRVKSVITLHQVIACDKELIADLLPPSLRGKYMCSSFFRLFLIIWYKLVGVLVDKIIVHSNSFKNVLVSRYGLNKNKVVVVYHGISYDHRALRENQRDRKKGMVLYLGVLSPRKGIETLLNAFSKFLVNSKLHKLYLIGVEPPYYNGYKNILENYARNLGIEQRVQFCGYVDDENVEEFLRKAEFLVLPYHHSISASGVLSLALENKVPTIVSDTEFFREETQNGICCLLAKTKDSDDLAKCMIRMHHDKELRRKLISNISGLLEKRSWRHIAKITAEIYMQITR